MDFSLVPWWPVIDQRLGQQIAATMRGGGVSREIGRQRGRLFHDLVASSLRRSRLGSPIHTVIFDTLLVLKLYK